MTGNVIFSGFALGGAAGFKWWALLLAIVAFLGGAWTGGHLCRRYGRHRGQLLFAAVLAELALLAAAWVVSLVVAPPYSDQPLIALIVLLGLAMGLQNATARALAVPDLTTTVLTLTLTGIAADATAGRGSRMGRRTVPVLAMFLGALGGTALLVHGHEAATLGIATVLLAAVALPALLVRRSTEPWTAQA
jgi:uncharacterized membrane protein YoaK (UPF0700 family)